VLKTLIIATCCCRGPPSHSNPSNYRPVNGAPWVRSRARKLDMRYLSGREATTYTLEFNEEENGLTFATGCSDFSTNRAFIWTSWMACPVQPDAGDSAERARLRSSPDCQAEDAPFRRSFITS
jgi:hypothetical protein